MLYEYFNNKKILVTGAAGFLGSHLVKNLLDNGAIVTGVDNFITGKKRNLISHHNFSFIENDVINKPESYLATDYVPDLIFHFASPASPPGYQKHPVETYLVNSMGTHQLLSYLRQMNSNGRFILAGTSEAYGDPLEHPQKESYWGNVNPNGPRACYDVSKRMAETICGIFYRDFAIDTRIGRIFNTYGPHLDPDDGRVISNFIKQAIRGEKFTIYGDGSQTRSYCYVSDLIDGFLRLASFDNLAGQTINIGNPDEYTVLETAKIISKLTNQPFKTSSHPFPTDDPTRRQPDISKAQELLDWSPKVKFEDGLKETTQWFQQNLD